MIDGDVCCGEKLIRERVRECSGSLSLNRIIKIWD